MASRDLLALVEARAADDAIGQAERDEAVLEGAHLEGGAHQDRDLVERLPAFAAAPRSPRRWRAPPRSSSQTPETATGSPSSSSVNSVLPSRPSLWAMRPRGGGEDMAGGAVVALQPDDLGAGKVLLEAQDVVDLGAAPAIDRLVVVADAADVGRSPPARAAAATDTGRRWCPGTRRPACSGSGADSRRARRGSRGTGAAPRAAGRRNRRRSAPSGASGRRRRARRPCPRRRRRPRPRGTLSGVRPRFFQPSIRAASWRAGQRSLSMPLGSRSPA